jgi:hypothetical protein
MMPCAAQFLVLQRYFVGEIAMLGIKGQMLLEATRRTAPTSPQLILPNRLVCMRAPHGP